MQNYSQIKSSNSTQSIDITKPEGMSSFWNLFSKNNKKGLQTEDNSVKLGIKPLKLNSVALKILKLKGIDLTNLDSLEQKNNILVINANQTNPNKTDLLMKNVLFNVMQSQNKGIFKNVDDREINNVSSSNVSIKPKKTNVEHTMTHLQPKKVKVSISSDKKIIKPNEINKGISTEKLIPSNSVMFKSVPKSKLTKSNRKTVIVPIYLGKKNSKNSNNLDNHSNLSNHELNENAVATLAKKIKNLEDELNNLKVSVTKTKDNTPLKSSKQSQSPTPNLNKPLIQYQPELCSSIANEAKNLKSTTHWLQRSKKDTGISVRTYQHKPIEKQDQDTSLQNAEDGKGDEESSQRIEEVINILNNPDVLINNHKLIIPRDVSKESLFQANPHAGCDTILKLFNVLSKKTDSNNQQKHVQIEGESNIIKENINEVDSAHSRDLDELNLETVFKCSSSKNKVRGINFPIINTKKDFENNCIKSNNHGLRNIFSLPVNLSILKSIECKKINQENVLSEKVHSKADQPTDFCSNIDMENVYENNSYVESVFEQKSKSLLEKCTTDMKNDYGKDTYVGSVSEQNSKPSFINCVIEEENVDGKDTYMESVCEQENKSSVEKFETEIIDSVVSEVHEKLEGERKSEECMNKILVSKSLTKSKSCESRLSEVIKKEEDSISNHQMECVLSISGEEVEKDTKKTTSVEALHRENECCINKFHLNIDQERCEVPSSTKQPQKLLKKTTISCPVKIPDQNLSITIVIENNLVDKNQFIGHVSSTVETLSLYHPWEIEDTKSTDVKQFQLVKEENVSNRDITAAEEPYCDLGCVQDEELKPNNKVERRHNINSEVASKQVDLGKSNMFQPESSVTYLTQEQRKIFDEKVLGVENYEKSINLSSFKLNHQLKNSFSTSRYGPGLINIFSESSFSSRKAKIGSKHKLTSSQFSRKISNRYRRSCSRNPFYMESFSVKKQSKTKIFQPDKSFNKDIESKNILQESNFSKPNQFHLLPKNEKIFEKNEFFKPQTNMFLNNSDAMCSEGLVSDDAKKRSCRFKLTLNEESMMRQAAKNFPSIKKTMEDGDHKLREKETVKAQHYQALSSSNCVNFMTQGSIDRLEEQLFKESFKSCSQNLKLSQFGNCVNSPLEKSKKFFDTNYEVKCNIPSKRLKNPQISVAEKQLKQFIFMENEIKSNIETQLKKFQYINFSNEIGSNHPNSMNTAIKQNNLKSEVVNTDLSGQLKNLGDIGINLDLSSSFDCDPNFICYKTVHSLSSQNMLDGRVQNGYPNEEKEKEKEIKWNKTKQIYCSNCGCLPEISEEDLTEGVV